MERPTKAAWWRKRGEEGDARVGESCEVSLGRSFETRGEVRRQDGLTASTGGLQITRGQRVELYVLQDASARETQRALVLSIPPQRCCFCTAIGGMACSPP